MIRRLMRSGRRHGIIEDSYVLVEGSGDIRDRPGMSIKEQ